jgi:eukaryotic-like serine/threonine-protein kinase
LQRFDETRQVIHEAQAQKQDNFVLRNALYALAFIGADSAAMAHEQQWYAGKPEEDFGLALASDTEAYGGYLGKARELTKRAVDSAIRTDSKENGAIWQANAALEQAAYGNSAEARQSATEALNLAPASQGVEVEAALAFAMAGDPARAESLAQDLAKRYPLDTQVQVLWLPAIQAQLALNKENLAAAVSALQAATSPLELGQIQFVANLSCLYPTYVRGEARTWQPDRAVLLPPSFRRFSTTAASCGTAGLELWLVWAWLVPMPCSRDPSKGRMPMPPASVRSPPIRIS